MLLDEALRAPDGDLRAFEQLVVRHQRRILADCRSLTRDPAHSEDLAQEVFVKAYFGLRKFEGRSSFRHWLQRIKVHHCLNHIKREQRRTSVAIDEESEGYEELRVEPVADRRVERLQDRERIAQILEALPTTLRVPLVMRDMDELSYEEIARALNIGLSAAKMRVKRGRERFRELFGLVYRNGDEVRLTRTEYDLLRTLAVNAVKVMTHRQLLQTVWGPEYGDETEYLRTFIKQLRRKLEPDPSRPQNLLTEPGVGYRLIVT